MGILKRILGLEPQLTKLLSAKIVTDEAHKYFVSFSKHHPQLRSPEFARLVLHYYAKTLYNLGSSGSELMQSASILMNLMRSVLAQGIERNADVLRLAGIDDVASIVATLPRHIPREFCATLYFIDTTRRHITTDIPKNGYAQHMVFSVMALLQATLKELDPHSIRVLSESLKRMNNAYESGQSISDLRALTAIPNAAFLSAVTGV
jgi:hypothetical protein